MIAAVQPVLEFSPTGRARCRGCGAAIAKGERRLGSVFASPFAEDRMTTHWYHLRCAAYKRPDVLLVALHDDAVAVDQRDELIEAARRGIELRRLPRIDGAERAPTGRASCRSCKQKIDRGRWRIRLVILEDDRFVPAGFVHAGCAADYFETGSVLARAVHFSRNLGAADVGDLGAALAPGAQS